MKQRRFSFDSSIDHNLCHCLFDNTNIEQQQLSRPIKIGYTDIINIFYLLIRYSDLKEVEGTRLYAFYVKIFHISDFF